MKFPRSNPNAFILNEAIYAFGGAEGMSGMMGEKYTFSENKWREVKPKNLNEFIASGKTSIGPTALLYE